MATKADHDMSLRMQALAEAMDEVLEEQYGSRCGFVLIIAPFDQKTTEVQYTSNIDRPQSLDLIRHLFQRWGEGLPDIPTHEKQ